VVLYQVAVVAAEPSLIAGQTAVDPGFLGGVAFDPAGDHLRGVLRAALRSARSRTVPGGRRDLGRVARVSSIQTRAVHPAARSSSAAWLTV